MMFLQVEVLEFDANLKTVRVAPEAAGGVASHDLFVLTPSLLSTDDFATMR